MVSIVNAKADVLRATAALAANCNAAKGLQEVVKSNFGPHGTLKMLVGGAGQIKITKDGCVLLHEMQIQHPTASMIARAATAQDESTGDGTTSSVLLIGELLRQSERLVFEGVHPRLLCRGFDKARTKCLEVLDQLKVSVPFAPLPDRELLHCVARTSLRTKLQADLADKLTPDVVDAVCLIAKPEEPQLDLFMVEILHMRHGLASETKLVRGMVMDHGARHPDMPTSLKKCFILTCNVSLEYEKSEVNSGFFYSSAEEREKMVEAERRFTDEKVKKIIEFKRKVCTPENGMSFVVLNQKGIDPPSLDLFAKDGILALRRVKRRNMERLSLCCGGNPVNCVEDLVAEDLGYAEHVYEQTLGDEKYTFVDGVRNPQSCCILIKGPNDHTIAQIKDALRDGLRAVKNVFEDRAVVPGAGAYEVAAYSALQTFKKHVQGKEKLAVEAFAQAMLAIPKVLAENSGLDAQEAALSLVDAFENKGQPVGLNLATGEALSPAVEGIWDNYRVKRQVLSIAPTLAQQLLLVDEVLKAGKSMSRG
ncbi:putative TCP-1 chaperonin [Besnoitia besnoiti]|uniref:Putative TCP-1 chaperonin n=1 Tax=Besnoitia besnoiti TaxID=94643 RepID=A0A2A9MCS9_BESBE|nr:putative TCP-1 chaperonin [Besnoitia besnoiti]PFH36298.1 putative TCP-1 chaperonin [Besnoitia besnoiti]